MADPNDSPNFSRVDPFPEEWASVDRYKHPRASLPSLNPPKPTAPLEKNFEILLNKYIESCAEKGMDDSTAINDLLQNLGSVQQARKFFSETAEYFKDTALVGCDITEFKRRLKTANWITGGEDLGFVYRAFRHKRFIGDDYLYPWDYIPLGMFDNFLLAVEIGLRAIAAQEADSATIESCNMFSITSHETLEVRYDSIGSGNEKQTMVFTQFGKIFYASIDQPDPFRTLDERSWYDTRFVLALELQRSGLPGTFYVMCNLTWHNDYEEMTDEEIYGDPNLLKFCQSGPSFTVARVEGQGLDLLNDSWKKIRKEKERIKLTVLSDRIPEIVETGWKSDEMLVGLFRDLEKTK